MAIWAGGSNSRRSADRLKGNDQARRQPRLEKPFNKVLSRRRPIGKDRSHSHFGTSAMNASALFGYVSCGPQSDENGEVRKIPSETALSRLIEIDRCRILRRKTSSPSYHFGFLCQNRKLDACANRQDSMVPGTAGASAFSSIKRPNAFRKS